MNSADPVLTPMSIERLEPGSLAVWRIEWDEERSAKMRPVRAALAAWSNGSKIVYASLGSKPVNVPDAA